MTIIHLGMFIPSIYDEFGDGLLDLSPQTNVLYNGIIHGIFMDYSWDLMGL